MNKSILFGDAFHSWFIHYRYSYNDNFILFPIPNHNELPISDLSLVFQCWNGFFIKKRYIQQVAINPTWVCVNANVKKNINKSSEAVLIKKNQRYTANVLKNCTIFAHAPLNIETRSQHQNCVYWHFLSQL